MSAPKYMAAVLERAAAYRDLDPETKVLHVQVCHDDWCGVFKAPPGPCDCDPDVGLITEPDRSAS